MGYSTLSTIWPCVPVSLAVQQLIDSLFATLDDSGPSAGDKLADEIFAAEGVIAGRHPSNGSAAIRRSRDNAWGSIQSRRHTIERVYSHDAAGTDLLLIGNVACGVRDGPVISVEFTSRIVVDMTKDTAPRILLYQVWMDPAPVREAVARVSK